jgi:hypothetical protein
MIRALGWLTTVVLGSAVGVVLGSALADAVLS